MLPHISPWCGAKIRLATLLTAAAISQDKTTIAHANVREMISHLRSALEATGRADVFSCSSSYVRSPRAATRSARKEAALESRVATPGRLCFDGRFRRSPTFARLHYHGPGGLNGRVRNGNGCDPAGMVAGKAAGGLSRHAGRNSSGFSMVDHTLIIWWFTATPFEQGK